MAEIINIIAILLFLSCWILVIKKIVWNRFAPVKTVKAEVFDKYQANNASKYPGVFKQGRYMVVFATKDKKLAFAVSEISYHSYKIKEKGTLKYKGNQIISFQ